MEACDFTPFAEKDVPKKYVHPRNYLVRAWNYVVQDFSRNIVLRIEIVCLRSGAAVHRHNGWTTQEKWRE